MYHSRAPRGLRVHHKDFGRAHQVDRDLFAEFQALRSHLLSGVRTIYGDSKRFRVERLRVDIGGEFVSKEFQGYCLQTGVSLEHTSTNTPQQIGMSERVGRTLAAMVRRMLADSGLPKSLLGVLMFTAGFLGNRAPQSAIVMQSPYKMPHRMEPDLLFLRVIGARAFPHFETQSKKLELKAVEGRLVGYSNNTKNYRIGCTIRPPGALWRTGTSSSSRHHRAYSRHRWKKFRSRIFRRATARTTATTSQTTTFCATFAIILACWNLFPLRLLTTSPWAGSQTICRWLNSSSGSARSPGGTHKTEELHDHCKKGLCPGESLRMEFHRRALSNRRSNRGRPQEPPCKHHWVDHSRFNNGGIRV